MPPNNAKMKFLIKYLLKRFFVYICYKFNMLSSLHPFSGCLNDIPFLYQSVHLSLWLIENLSIFKSIIHLTAPKVYNISGKLSV